MARSQFWRSRQSSLVFTEGIPDDFQVIPQKHFDRMESGMGLLVGDFNESTACGDIEWVGIISDCDSDTHSIKVVWRNADFSLRPTSAGKGHWRRRDWFNFAEDVVERYMLDAIFSDIFDNLQWSGIKTRTRLVRPTPRETPVPIPAAYPDGAPLFGLPVVRPSSNPTAGYVYLIWSKYGYKIGKAINVRNRTRLFEVKLPFPITVMHYARFDDYSQAEHALHRHFHEKRLEGEWFELDDDDVAFIRTLGDPQPVDAL